MKHLLIIILSFLLLSSPVIGDNHKGETLYLWETSSGGEVWKGFGDKETHSVYKGDVKNGVPNGLGIMIDNIGGKYIGEWKDGLFHGQGKFTSLNASMYYVGGYKKGKRDGQGVLTFLDGLKYEGGFKDGKWNGQGTLSSLNGRKYVGEWKDGKQNGRGTSSLCKGGKYVGEFKDGKQRGKGTKTYSDGEKYVRERKDGRFWNGIGYDKNRKIKSKYVNGVKQ